MSNASCIDKKHPRRGPNYKGNGGPLQWRMQVGLGSLYSL
jgi:hypothetical protein